MKKLFGLLLLLNTASLLEAGRKNIQHNANRRMIHKTPLLRAIKEKDEEKVKDALSKLLPHEVAYKHNNQHTALSYANTIGNHSAISLIQMVLHANQRKSFSSELIKAISLHRGADNTDLVDQIAHYRHLVNVIYSDGMSPLRYAQKIGNTVAIDHLKAAGART